MTTPERQEQSLVEFGYAPGNYFCICCSCNNQFQGDKRAPRCKSCAEKLQEKQAADSAKTTPERGLFERIEPFLESLHPNSAWRNRIKAEIEKFEQRLAEAEKERDQLRARCGELEGLRKSIRNLRPQLIEVYDFINEPQRLPSPEPMEVRNYRHQLYRKWEKLADALNELTATAQPAQQDECTRAGKHDWGSITGGMSCYKCGTSWWANTPEPKPAQETEE